jgi:hypothetical protein
MGDIGYVATKGRYYLIGGYGSSGNLSSVYSAPINSDGTLGSFRTETSLPDGRSKVACFVIKDKLYVVGGDASTVYRTTVNNDGTLNSWETLSDFPVFFYTAVSLLIKDRIYIFGAYDGNNSYIYYTTYDSDGNIGSWNYVSNMLNNLCYLAVACTDNYVFSIGGWSSSNYQQTNAAYRAPISSDGSIGDWTQISDGPITASAAQPVIAGNMIHFIGGYYYDSNNNRGVCLDTVYSATFNSGITDYTPYYTDQRVVDPNNFYLPNYYPDFKSVENYYIKY